jgi:hypothetical protein
MRAATTGWQMEMDPLKKLGFLGSKRPTTLMLFADLRALSTDWSVFDVAGTTY